MKATQEKTLSLKNNNIVHRYYQSNPPPGKGLCHLFLMGDPEGFTSYLLTEGYKNDNFELDQGDN